MRDDWKDFLQDVGAEFAPEQPHRHVHNYGAPQDELHLVRNGLVISDLSHYGLVGVHDTEAAGFLQNQLTNDVQQISETHAQRSAWCSAKGRILSTFQIIKRGDSFYLQVPMPLLESTLKRLRMFVLRTKVTVEDDSDAWVQFGVAGPKAHELIRQVFGAAPQETDACLTTAEYSVVRLSGEAPRFWIISAPAAAQGLWTKLQAQAIPVGANAWRLLDIRAGVPTIYPETQDAFVPQMMNLEILNGVSFTKGCYPGQEVVARMQYLGTLKRRMFPVQFASDVEIQPGAELYSPGSKSGQGAGRLADIQQNGDGLWEGLAVMEIAAAERHDVFLDAAHTIPVSVGNLPYSLGHKD